LTGHYPTRVLLIGCQPENMMDYGGSLRASVRAAMEGALDEALRVLDSWGAAPQKRATPLTGEEAVTLPHLELRRYENERPSEQQACRIGDERILARRA
jgi:hydrogenase maturation protease